jgi:hypothetical protein
MEGLGPGLEGHRTWEIDWYPAAPACAVGCIPFLLWYSDSRYDAGVDALNLELQGEKLEVPKTSFLLLLLLPLFPCSP